MLPAWLGDHGLSRMIWELVLCKKEEMEVSHPLGLQETCLVSCRTGLEVLACTW